MYSLFGLNALSSCQHQNELLSRNLIWRSIRKCVFFSLYWIYSIAETLNILINECLKCSNWKKRERNFSDWGLCPLVSCLCSQSKTWWSSSTDGVIVLKNHSCCQTHARGKITAEKNTGPLEMVTRKMPRVTIWMHPKFKFCLLLPDWKQQRGCLCALFNWSKCHHFPAS